MIDKIATPDWAVSDEETEKLIPESGFIRDYLLYMKGCTDAPLIFHYGTIMTILSCATSGADIFWQPPDRPGRCYRISTPIQSVVTEPPGVGRKSSCIDQGVYLLAKAKEAATDLLVDSPGDGSLDGWYDFMQKHVVERSSLAPRTAILGCITPTIFEKIVSEDDWNSRALAKLTFWPGKAPGSSFWLRGDPNHEATVVNWLREWALPVKGHIYLNDEVLSCVNDWFEPTIEDRRRNLPSWLLTHFSRYSDLGIRLAALHAVARGRNDVNDPVQVIKTDAQHAVKVLSQLHSTMHSFFAAFGKGSKRQEGYSL